MWREQLYFSTKVLLVKLSNKVTSQAGQWRPGLLQAEDLLLALISSNSWSLLLSQSKISLTAFLALFSSIFLGNLLLLLPFTSCKAGWLT